MDRVTGKCNPETETNSAVFAKDGGILDSSSLSIEAWLILGDLTCQIVGPARVSRDLDPRTLVIGPAI